MARSKSDISSTPATRSAGPWRSAWQHVRKDRVAMGSLVVLILIVAACVAAPLYANNIAHVDAFASNVQGTYTLNGVTGPVLVNSTEGLGLGVTPIGPTWNFSTYFLGADNQGRDVFARILYGGRNSLLIGFVSAVLCCMLAGLVGVVAGYFGKGVDAVLSRALDVLWAFPVYLLAICLSVVLINTTLTIGPWTLTSGSLLLPILIIGIIYVPYVARPIRGQVMSLREREFVQAAVGAGAKDSRLLRRELLPNVLPTLIVFLPLMTAINMLTESALSFLSIGVQPPDASWGTIINDGVGLLYTRPMVAIAPGIILAITAVALNLLGDGVRDALDPKARLRGSL
ncbi:MAG: ABC transporter permease [Actinomycetia bacterium]|nr:ABC transporter permease [Actinomycetes bacterium]